MVYLPPPPGKGEEYLQQKEFARGVRQGPDRRMTGGDKAVLTGVAFLILLVVISVIYYWP